MDLLSQSLKSDRYYGSSVTTLGPAALAEIGRVMAHHGLLVAHVRDFVLFVSSQTNRLPTSVGSKEAIKLLPTVLEMIRPAFSPDNVHILLQVLDQVTRVRNAVDRFFYSVWGTLTVDPEKFRRTDVGARLKLTSCAR